MIGKPTPNETKIELLKQEIILAEKHKLRYPENKTYYTLMSQHCRVAIWLIQRGILIHPMFWRYVREHSNLSVGPVYEMQGDCRIGHDDE